MSYGQSASGQACYSCTDVHRSLIETPVSWSAGSFSTFTLQL